jgi:hypothetical protein
MAWLKEPKCTLEELQIISAILNRWDLNHRRTLKGWRSDPSEEEAQINRQIIALCEKLKAKHYGADNAVVSLRNN